MKMVALVVVGWLTLPHALIAQQREPDVLFVAGTMQSGADVGAGGGEVEWLRTASPSATVMIGGAMTSFSDLWWSYGTVAGSVRRSRIVYSGRASLGAGRWSQGSFPYAQYVGAATTRIGRGFYGESEVQHVRMAGTAVTVVQLGATYAVPAGLSLKLAYHLAPSESTQAVSARGDISIGRFTVLGGLVASARQASPTSVPALEVTTRIAPEYFGGCTVPMGASSVTVTAQVVPQPTGRLVRLLMTLRHPLGSSRP